MTPEMARAVAQWWGRHLRGTDPPIDQTTVDRVDAAGPKPGVFKHIQARLRERLHTPEHQARVGIFEKTLVGFLTLPSWPEGMHEYGRDFFPSRFILHNEYNPYSCMLIESLKAAEINYFSLPYKTTMFIEREVITVRRDDRSIEVVWGTPE